MNAELRRYDPGQTYLWNYEQAPSPVELAEPTIVGRWNLCGVPVASPLGVAAGPLLNGRWVLYYASLGFDVLTYKTVRSRMRPCYPLPNLQHVQCDQLTGGEQRLPAATSPTGSWAVSFGMPSMHPDVWRGDVEWTRARLPREKLLNVSVVGTVQPDWSIDQLADDYAQCARWAIDSGADSVETNFSCPNVSTCDGQLYQQPAMAAIVAQRVRAAIGHRPYLVKIGHVCSNDEALALLEAIAPHVDGIVMTNSVAATIADAAGKLLFDGQRRGICGEAIREASLAQTALFARLVSQRKLNLQLFGVGGIRTAAHVRAYLDAGAAGVQIATAAMLDPQIAIKIREMFA